MDEAGDARYYEACAYFHRDKDEDGCISCPGGEDGCARIAMRDIADRMVAFDNALADTDCYTLMIIDFLKSCGMEVEDEH